MSFGVAPSPSLPNVTSSLNPKQEIQIKVHVLSYLLYLWLIFTGRNEVLAKVIFLHVCVILFTGGVPAPNFRGGCLLQISGGVPAPNFRGGCLLQISGGCLLQIFGGGACSKFRGGACSKFSGGCLLQISGGGGACSKFSGGVPAPNFRGGGVLQFSEYGHRLASTHPTGMHSCDITILNQSWSAAILGGFPQKSPKYNIT